MTATDKPTQSIVVEYPLRQAPRLVWRALTEPDPLAKWLMPNDVRPIVGHRFTMRAEPIPGWDGTVHCEMLAVEPLRKFTCTWRGGSSSVQGDGHTLDTVVTWTLTSTPRGVRFCASITKASRRPPSLTTQ